ncbi:hypothetical protein T492DRAFT_904659, partial [Pavlovales sp. CCMP2436]
CAGTGCSRSLRSTRRRSSSSLRWARSTATSRTRQSRGKSRCACASTSAITTSSTTSRSASPDPAVSRLPGSGSSVPPSLKFTSTLQDWLLNSLVNV